MSEAPDQPAGAQAPVADVTPGVEAAAPAATSDDTDIDTEVFDRAEAPAGEAEGAPAGQPEDDAEPPAADPEVIEVEAAGEKFKVPAALKPFLMMQEDYTKKTQAVAERGRELEAKATELASQESQQAERFAALRAEHVTAANREAELSGIDAQLAKYADLTTKDWADLKAQDPDQYRAHSDNYDFLKRSRGIAEDALGKAKATLTAKEAELIASQKAAREGALTKAWAGTNATLREKIEGWSPAKGQELGQYLVDQFGVKEDELKEATDPRVWMMADRLKRAEAQVARLKTSQKQAAATETALKSQAVQPAAKSAGSGAQATGVKDDLRPKNG
jgi:hypothetical protein